MTSTRNPLKESSHAEQQRLQYIAIAQIHDSTTNPRQTFEQNKLEELAESIRQHGLIQPITVSPDGFEIVAGARRVRAAQLTELFSVPARIVELDDAAASGRCRADLLPVEVRRGTGVRVGVTEWDWRDGVEAR